MDEDQEPEGWGLVVPLVPLLPPVYVNMHFFYPWGNTRPLYLLQNVPPRTDDQQATRVLLLGCGDFRDILFTLACEER